MVLAGCSGAPDPQTKGGLAALVADFRSQSAEKQLARIASTSSAAERELWRLSGLESELGGADAADEVFAGLQEQLDTMVTDVGQDDTAFVLASSPAKNGASTATDGLGAGIFGGMVISDGVADNAITSTNDGGSVGSASFESGGSTLTLTATPEGAVNSSFEATTSLKGVAITIAAATEINPCPDANGDLTPKGVFDVRTAGPNGSGSRIRLDIELDLFVNDDAGVAMSEYAYTAQYFEKPDGTTEAIVDFAVDSNGEYTTSRISADTSAKFKDNAIGTAAFVASWVAQSLEKAAKKGWESGRCIDLRANASAGPTGLKPSSEVTITASPFAKSDGKPAGGTVTAQLSAGGDSVSPSATKVKANADFAYVAPDKKNQSGTVALESRSKRGVGKTSITLDTEAAKAFTLVGGGGDWFAEGTTCDISQPFSVSGTGLTMAYTPTGPAGGSYTLSGDAGGVVWSGGGTYSVALAPDGGGALITAGINTISTEVGVFSDSYESAFVLTPLAACR